MIPKEAIFSPCRNCDYRHYDKSRPLILLDADGYIIHFLPAEDRYHLRKRLKKGYAGQTIVKNPCDNCKAAAAYDDLINCDTRRRPRI